MSIPTHTCGPFWEGGTEERISPERPEPQPMSRMSEGEERERRERARWVMFDWMVWIRELVVYLAEVRSE